MVRIFSIPFVLIITALFQPVTSTDENAIVSDQQFQTEILDSFKASFVYVSSSSVNSDLVKSWTGKLPMYDINLFHIDCSLKSNQKSCKSFQLPSDALLFYADKPELNPYTRKYFRKPISFTGTPSASALERFVGKNFPNLISSVKSVDQLNEFYNKNVKMSYAFLFTEKETIPLLFKSIAFQYRDKIAFVAVNVKSSSDVVSHFKIETSAAPLMAILPAGSDDDSTLVVYSGSLGERSEILTWLDPFAPQKKFDGTDDNNSSKPNKKQSSMQDNADILSAGNWISATDSLDIESLLSGQSYLIGVFPAAAVVRGSPEMELWRKVAVGCDGNVKPVMINCSNSFKLKSEPSLGNVLCLSMQGEPITTPYLYVLPYSSKARPTKQIVLTEKYTKKLDEGDAAKALALESLPKTNIRYLISESAFQTFLGENFQLKKLSVVALSKKSEVSPLLHNVALTISNIKSLVEEGQAIAEVGFLSEPSPEFLNSLGNPKLPAVLAFFFEPSSAELDNHPGAGAKIALYDTTRYGPMKHNSLSTFIQMVYSE